VPSLSNLRSRVTTQAACGRAFPWFILTFPPSLPLYADTSFCVFTHPSAHQVWPSSVQGLEATSILYCEAECFSPEVDRCAADIFRSNILQRAHRSAGCKGKSPDFLRTTRTRDRSQLHLIHKRRLPSIYANFCNHFNMWVVIFHEFFLCDNLSRPHLQNRNNHTSPLYPRLRMM
jgi:hypothetical protein